MVPPGRGVLVLTENSHAVVAVRRPTALGTCCLQSVRRLPGDNLPGGGPRSADRRRAAAIPPRGRWWQRTPDQAPSRPPLPEHGRSTCSPSTRRRSLQPCCGCLGPFGDGSTRACQAGSAGLADCRRRAPRQTLMEHNDGDCAGQDTHAAERWTMLRGARGVQAAGGVEATVHPVTRRFSKPEVAFGAPSRRGALNKGTRLTS